MSEERLSMIEREVHAHKTEMKIIATTMEKLVEQGEKTHELIHQALLRDERFEAKLSRLSDQLESRINTQHETITHAHTRIDKINTIFSRINWSIIVAVLGGLLSLVIIKPY